LAETPKLQPKVPLVSVKEAVEAIVVKGLEAYIVTWRKQNGFLGFPNNFIEKKPGVMATTQNWSTVTKILQFARR